MRCGKRSTKTTKIGQNTTNSWLSEGEFYLNFDFVRGWKGEHNKQHEGNEIRGRGSVNEGRIGTIAIINDIIIKYVYSSKRS